jgi:hypothetical protein
LRVRAEKGVDAIRSLRGWLKVGLKTFGLKVLEITLITPREEELAMDMRRFASKYIKPDHVRDGPLQTRIVAVLENEQFGRPVLELETGSQFTVNETNNDTLVRAWGYNSNDWIGREIELLLGSYHDRKSKTDKETVKVHPLSPAKSAAGNGGEPASKPLPASRASLKDDLEDDLPF